MSPSDRSDLGWQQIELKKAVEADLAADIEKQGAYVSPFVRRVKVEDGTRVRYEVAPGGDLADVKAKMDRYVDLMVTKFRKLPKKVLATRERKDKGELARGVYDELKRRSWVAELGRGQVALSGPALNVLRAVDQDACRVIGIEAFGAREATYPTLIPSKTLGRCGYFSSFPQSVSMVTHLVEDFDKIEEFRQANANTTDLIVPDFNSFTVPEACMSPAVCYHCYRSLEGKALNTTHVTTTVGKCFRYESTNITGLDRLWDFTMREVIFVGTEGEVTERRRKGIDRVMEQIDRFDLEAQIETANDPFFSAAYATKTYYQVRSDLKFELRLTVEPGGQSSVSQATPGGEPRTLACASFNLHENFFGKTFSITAADGEPAFTGCLAWGLERWVLACFTQHGFEPSRWPAEVRAKVWG
jgi:seryl-tRNA synthetase